METNTGTVETLENGQCLLVDARVVKDGAISLQFAEVIRPADEQMSLLAYSNRYNEAFSTKARRSWLITDVQAATEDYGVDFSEMNENWYEGQKGTMLDLNILNPVLNGYNVRLAIKETIEPTPYQQENIETSCKTRGKGGDPITHKGEYIFSNVIVVGVKGDQEVAHTRLEADPVGVQVEESQVQLTTESMVDELESNEIGL
jgi:hypothetical protein